MISPWTIYWITRLDDVGYALSFCFAVSIMCFLASVVARVVSYGMESDLASSEEAHLQFRLARKWFARITVASLIGCPVFGLGGIALPTSKEMAAIYLIPAIANNEEIQAETSELYDLAKDYLRQQAGKEEGE